MNLPIHDLPLFAAAALLVNLTPGPDMLFVIGNSLAHGRRAGLAAALGIGAGCLLHIAMAAVGLSALIAASPTAFALVKWAGAAYLAWIGVSMLRAALWPRAGEARLDASGASGARNAFDAGDAGDAGAVAVRRAFRQGAMTNALNPKVAIFFLALLPQFIDAGAPGQGVAFAALGMLFNVSGTLVNLIVAWLASGMRSAWGRAGRTGRDLAPRARWLQAGAGAMFVALGAKLAFATR